MRVLVDGSNVLGVLGRDRYSDDAKRSLVRDLARWARATSSRVTCFFDGDEPPSFGTDLGAVRVVFTGRRIADDRIVDASSSVRGAVHVVTSDAGLAARVRRRDVTVHEVRRFASMVEQTLMDAPGASATEEDWSDYFSDPNNRLF